MNNSKYVSHTASKKAEDKNVNPKEAVSFSDLGKAAFELISYSKTKAELESYELPQLVKEIAQELDIARLSRMLVDAQKNNKTGDRMVMVTGPGSDTDFCTEQMCRIIMMNYTETAVIYNESLLISFDLEDMTAINGIPYIGGDIIVREIDEEGNECDVDFDTIRNFIHFKYENLVTITVFDTEFDAYRLV